QLIGRREPGGTGSDDGGLLAAAVRRRPRHDPAFAECPIDELVLDGLDGDRVVVDVEDAGPFARRWTQAAGELGEVVRREQALDRRLPAVAIHQIVPVRNQVPERTALVAKGDAAVHAPRALLADRLDRV